MKKRRFRPWDLKGGQCAALCCERTAAEVSATGGGARVRLAAAHHGDAALENLEGVEQYQRAEARPRLGAKFAHAPLVDQGGRAQRHEGERAQVLAVAQVAELRAAHRCRVRVRRTLWSKSRPSGSFAS